MKTRFLVCLLVSMVTFSSSYADRLLKVAVLDNLINEDLSSYNYVDYYLSGIEAASVLAKKNHITIEYKTFFYDRGSLSILKKLPELEAWHPDVIIGPRDSNNFLLLQKQLKDDNILVISPYATAADVYRLPKNFYSLTPSAEYTGKAITRFLDQKFKDKSIYAIVQVDCKSCVDGAMRVIENYNNKHPKNTVYVSRYIGEESKSIDMGRLLNAYKNGQIILLTNMSVSSGILAMRIADYLQQENTIFIGDDNWGSWKSGAVGKFKSSYAYTGYRVVPWSLDIDTPELKQFKSFYEQQYHSDPPDNITYVMYTAILSILTALNDFPDRHVENMRENVLVSFQHALKKNPNWFRPEAYALYKVDMTGEKYEGEINVN